MEASTSSQSVGELRQNIITGEWVAIAAGRAKRPDEFGQKRETLPISQSYKEDCPFCNAIRFPQEPDTLRLPNNDHDWQVHIFGNKYPAFSPKQEFRTWNKGPYRAIEAVGYHEILAPRYHNKFEQLMSVQELSLQFEALTLRYRELKSQPSVNYIQIIKNHGAEAGGSVEHPHHQIYTIPVLPNDVAAILNGGEAYAKKHGKNPYTVMLDFEHESGERIVAENDSFAAFCPYASRLPFETWILPKKDQPFFEYITPQEREDLAEIMQKVLRKLYYGLKNPPYNYYIHSAPCDDTGFVCDMSKFKNFRWHIEILPRLSKFGGFELGTGLEINTALPENAAAFLRDQTIA